MERHDEFLELCAVSTSGELSEQEREKLESHLVGCPQCRQAFKEFKAAVDVGVPFLASTLAARQSADLSEKFVAPRTESEQVKSLVPVAGSQTDANDASPSPDIVQEEALSSLREMAIDARKSIGIICGSRLPLVFCSPWPSEFTRTESARAAGSK